MAKNVTKRVKNYQSQNRFSNFFSFFGMKLLWDDINNIL